MNVNHQFADLNGINIHYVEKGEGDLVILLHGFPEFWYSWKDQIPELSEKFRVVAPDLRGYNLSDKPKKVADYKMETLAKDIVALIKHLGEQKAYIVSHDWGGAIGWYLGMHYPEHVNKLIVLNAPHPGLIYPYIRSSFKQKMKSWYMLYFQVPVIPETFLKWGLGPILKFTLRGWSYRKEAFSPEILAKYKEAFRKKGACKATINYYRASYRGRKQLEKHCKRPITVPTRVIWGENDKALSKDMTPAFAGAVTAPYDIHYIKDCSHWVQQDHPEKVNRLIEEFFLAAS